MFLSKKYLVMVLATLIGAALLAACNDNVAALLKKNLNPTPKALVVIPSGQDAFKPFIQAIQPGMAVSWQNNDTVAHTIVTTQEQSTFLNPQAFTLHIAAGQKVSFTFSRPGIYDYFDSTRATWNKADQRVAANKGASGYPLAMEGVIWVQGPVHGLSSNVAEVIPGKDMFAHDFLAVRSGGQVTWHNKDTDDHFISLVPGWSKPINPVSLGTVQIKGANAQPGGISKTLTFATPGLYYYYCSAHAAVNTPWERAQAFKSASEAPIPMEGFLLVANSPQ